MLTVSESYGNLCENRIFWPYLKHVESKSLEETPGKLYSLFAIVVLKKKSSSHGSEDPLCLGNSGGNQSFQDLTEFNC